MVRHTVFLNYYNRPIWGNEALQSVINQTDKDWEMFLLDDGSDINNSLNILNQCSNDPRIIYYRHSPDIRTGEVDTTRLPSLINKFLPYAKGELFHYLVDDAQFDILRLEKCWTEYNINKYDFAYGDFIIHRPNRLEINKNKGTIIDPPIIHIAFTHNRNFLDKFKSWPYKLQEGPDFSFTRHALSISPCKYIKVFMGEIKFTDFDNFVQRTNYYNQKSFEGII